ncbi:unnamed protein product [Gongylonema pulchrum]|uniref:Protein kinase domain-containing protein n=1 Tax=Gongylonema pulchrum TaxID=637853 RepID=A0A3P6NXU3_9BILA|nr:unnamed protein product [Gongylonema pulchrum]
MFFQRPSAKELLKHAFIRKAKKNSFLMDLIERSVEYKTRLEPSSDSDQDEETDTNGGTDWVFNTVKAPQGTSNASDESNADQNTVRVKNEHVRPSIATYQPRNMSPNATIVNRNHDSKVAQLTHDLRQTSMYPSSSGAYNTHFSSLYTNAGATVNGGVQVAHNGNATTIAVSSPTSSPTSSLTRHSFAISDASSRSSAQAAPQHSLGALSQNTGSNIRADLDAVAMAFKEAEKNCPGVCDQFVVELLTTVAYPQATESELQAAVDRLTM